MANTLSILRPSVNNLSARIFVRAAGLEFEELDVWGKKDAPDFMRKDPALLTPMVPLPRSRISGRSRFPGPGLTSAARMRPLS